VYLCVRGRAYKHAYKHVFCAKKSVPVPVLGPKTFIALHAEISFV
jgi:hypothetical protein